jgi:hypothetical protein
MTGKSFWVGWILVSLLIQGCSIVIDNERLLKKSQWTFNVGLMGFFLS